MLTRAVTVRILSILLLATVFSVMSLTGVLLVPVNAENIVILRGSGVAIGVLLICGRDLGPGIFLGAIASRVWLAWMGYWDLSTTADALGAVGMALAISAQALVGSELIRRVCGFPLRLRGWRHLASVIFIVVPVSCLIVASLGVGIYAVSHGDASSHLLFHWMIWWIGDVIAVNLAVATAVLGPWNREPVAFWRKTPVPRFTTPALAYVVLSVAVTFTAWTYVSRLENDANRAQFERLVNDYEQALKHKLSVIKLAMDGGVGLFDASGRVTAEDWRRYVEALNLSQGAFGIRSLGVIVPVAPNEVDQFLNSARIDGVEGLKIQPEIKTSPMFVIKYIEPLATSRSALGLDITFEESRLQAAIAARDSGRATISAPITLVQGMDLGKGFLMLVPIYSGRTEPTTVAERRAAFEGWVYSAITADHVLSDLTQSDRNDLNVQVYDGSNIQADRQFYASPNPDPVPARTPARFRIVDKFDTFGRTWTVVWEGTANFEARLWSVKPAALLIGGLSFSVLLAVFLISLARREDLVRRIVEQRTRELATQVDENRSIIETAVATIALLDANGNLLRSNEAFSRLLVRDQSEMLGKPFPSLLNGQISEYFDQPDSGTNFPAYRGELSTTSSRGKTLILDVQIIPWKNSDGDRRYTVVMRDTSRYHHTAEQLRSTQRRLELALTAANIGVFDMDLRTRTSVVSQTWRDLMGGDTENDKGIDPQQTWLQRIHPDDLARVKAADLACIEGTAPRSISQYRVLVKDNSWRWMRSEMTGEERDENGRAWRMIGLMSDITDQHHVDELKKQFVATVSHELRTPLTSINGSISLLLNVMSEGIPDTAKRMLSIAQKNCDRLILLVNDILDLEKLENGIAKPILARANISEQVERAIQVNQPFAARFDVSYVLAQDVAGISVLIEENRFQQVMSNLMSNAAKFSPKGGTVSISIEQIGAQVAVSVTDNGRGIPVEFHDRIFKPFSQVDGTASRKTEGSGLGLHIAKRTIEQMDGSIGFDSVMDESTTFWVMLPIYAETMTQRGAAAPTRFVARPPSVAPKILHIEPDPDVAEVLAAAFLPLADVIHADTSGAAARYMSRDSFAMIIVGCDTNSADWAGLLAEIRLLQPSTPIVSLTTEEVRAHGPHVRMAFIKSRVQLDDVARQCLAIIFDQQGFKDRAPFEDSPLS